MTRSVEQSAYTYRAGDVLQRLVESTWTDYAKVTPVKRASALDATMTGAYCGVHGKWRIVRDGKQVAP